MFRSTTFVRLMKRFFLPLALSLFALAVPASASAAVFGAEVNGDFVGQSRGVWSQTQVMGNLTALYRAGGRVGRAESDWAATEPKAPVRGRHRYNWSYDDMIVSEMASARLRWEPTLAFAPRWAEVHTSNVLHLKGRGRVIAFLPPGQQRDLCRVRDRVHEALRPARRVLEGQPTAALCAGDQRRGVERARQPL